MGADTHRQDEAVLEVGELAVALLAAEHAVVLVHHLLVAVLRGAGLVQAVLLPQVHDGGHRAEVIRLVNRGREGSRTQRTHETHTYAHVQTDARTHEETLTQQTLTHAIPKDTVPYKTHVHAGLGLITRNRRFSKTHFYSRG